MPHASSRDVKETLDKALDGQYAGGESVPSVLNEIFPSNSGDLKNTFIQDLNLPTWMASALNNTIIKDKDSTITTNENNTESLVEGIDLEFSAGVTPPKAAIEGNALELHSGSISVVVQNENKANVNLSLTLKEGVSFLTFGVKRTVELDTGLGPGKEQGLAKALAFLAPRSNPPIKLDLSSLTIIKTLAILTQQSEDSVANTLKLRLPNELATGPLVTEKLDTKQLVVTNFAYTQKGQSDDATAQVQTWTLRIVPKPVDRIDRVPLKEGQIEIQAINFDYKRNRIDAPSLSVEGVATMKHGDKSIPLSLDENGFAFTSGFYEKDLTDIDYASIISDGTKTLQPDLGQLPGLTFDKKVTARGRTFVVIQSLEGSQDPFNAIMRVQLYARMFLFAVGDKTVSLEIVYKLDNDTWMNKSRLKVDGIANEVGKAQEMRSLIEPRLGKAILGSVEFSSALFGGMDASKWSDEIVTTLLSRKIMPPNVLEASRRLPVPDDNIMKWIADLDKDTADVKAAPVMQKAHPIYCKVSRNVTAFNTIVSARKMVLEDMIKDLEASPKADTASQLAKYRTTLADLTKAAQTGTSRVAELLAYLRHRLNQASPIIGVYLPNTGRVEIWWGRPKPGTFLHDENTWADRDTSHVVWEETIRPQNVYPSDDSRASLEWNPQEGNIMSRMIGLATSDYNYYDQWKNGNCYAWIRANYKENDNHIASEKWTPVTLFVLDAKFAARFTKIPFIDAKPTVSINGPFVNGDWYGKVSKNLEPEMQEFMRHEQLKWDVSISPTSDPNHGDAWRGTKKQDEMSHEQIDTKFVRWSNVWFHVRPVIDYERGTKRCEGVWVGAEGKRRPISNKLGPGDRLGVDEYLIVKSTVPGTTNISFRFKLDERWQFRLDKIDEKSAVIRALWAEGPDDRFSNDHVTMQKDGNLVVQSSIWHTKWESHTASNENAGSSLVLREDGNAVILRPDGTIAWQTNTMQLLPISEKNKLKYGEQLEADQNLWSPDGKYRFCPQKDNNLVTYGPGGVKWSSNTAWRNWRGDREGDRMIVGDDDNLNWFLKGGGCRWNTDTRRRKTCQDKWIHIQVSRMSYVFRIIRRKNQGPRVRGNLVIHIVRK
ncbi:hypothetical protein F4823DRAFT_608620 [Ustulina deusta]|nr:hypothetical protein F4823DRAFT_608620 [Ustulina deusta]